MAEPLLHFGLFWGSCISKVRKSTVLYQQYYLLQRYEQYMALLMNQEPHVHIETRDPLRSPSNGQLLMEGPKEHVKARATEQILLLSIGARRRYFTPKAIVSLWIRSLILIAWLTSTLSRLADTAIFQNLGRMYRTSNGQCSMIHTFEHQCSDPDREPRLEFHLLN